MARCQSPPARSRYEAETLFRELCVLYKSPFIPLEQSRGNKVSVSEKVGGRFLGEDGRGRAVIGPHSQAMEA